MNLTGFPSLLLGLPLGILLGAAGSLTGIGGGFLLMPALLWLFPDQAPGSLAVVTLTVVFFNALSGTVLSLRRETVHLRTGLTYGALSLPLVWLGSRLQMQADRHTFDLAFGILLLAGALFLTFKPAATRQKTGRGAWLAGAGASLAVGLVSGFFGVGGGFLFVPLLAYGLRYAVPEAAATSQLIVGLGAAWALLLAMAHPLPVDPMLLGGLVAGVLVGAPLGTAAAERWSGPIVLRILAGLLALAAVRFLV